MGFDSFGLPTENYAKKVGKPCKEVTEENENNFREEFKRMNTNYEILFSTTEPHYQKEVHRIYQILKDKGLVYRNVRLQEYCPSCDTVLAKEQTQGGICERCDTKVIQKEVEQTFFKITEYKDRLIQDLDKVDYPVKTKKQQINWLINLQDWSVSRSREWGCPIPDVPNETFDTFVDSSFYTIYYCKYKGLKPKPLDLYVGGNEHACMHLIYSRFITKVLFDVGEIDFDEPFNKVVHQGIILGTDGNKMSKSRGNIINPQDYDNTCALKMALMFIGPYEQGGIFNPNQYKSMCKFIRKWESAKIDNNISRKDTQIHLNNIDYAMKNFKFNKVVSEFMIFYNKSKSKNTVMDNLFNKIFNYNG